MPRFISLNIEYLFYQIYRFGYVLTHGGLFSPNSDPAGGAAAGQKTIFGLPAGAFSFNSVVLFFLFLIILLLLWALVYLLLRIRRSHAEHEWRLYEKAQESKAINASKENPKWKAVSLFTESENQSDWKIAVIEADKLLDEALQAFGAGGENLGERLKNFDKKTAPWIEDAWDAHKVRNRIAHEADYVLTKHEMRKTIGRYESALRSMQAI